jgi:hypothetical protein
MDMINKLNITLLAFLLLPISGCIELEDNDSVNDSIGGPNLEGAWKSTTSSTQYNRIDNMNFEYNDSATVTSYFVIRKNQSNGYDIASCSRGFEPLEINGNKLTLNQINYEIISDTIIQGELEISTPAEGLYEHSIQSSFNKLNTDINPIGIVTRTWNSDAANSSESDIYCAKFTSFSMSTSRGEYWDQNTYFYNGAERKYEYYDNRVGSDTYKAIYVRDENQSLVGSELNSLENITLVTSASEENGFSIRFSANDSNTHVDTSVVVSVPLK